MTLAGGQGSTAAMSLGHLRWFWPAPLGWVPRGQGCPGGLQLLPGYSIPTDCQARCPECWLAWAEPWCPETQYVPTAAQEGTQSRLPGGVGAGRRCIRAGDPRGSLHPCLQKVPRPKSPPASGSSLLHGAQGGPAPPGVPQHPGLFPVGLLLLKVMLCPLCVPDSAVSRADGSTAPGHTCACGTASPTCQVRLSSSNGPRPLAAVGRCRACVQMA